MANEKLRNTLTVALVLAIGLGGTLLHAFCGHSWIDNSGHAIGSDDAYISFRYAANFFHGHGLVFNPGERVEGYSNLLYTLLVTPGVAFGIDAVYPFSIALNCVLLALTLFAFWAYSRACLEPGLAGAAALLFALSPWVWANAASGLETVLILGITVGAWISVESYCRTGGARALLALGLFCVLSVFSRVDGFILPLICIAYLGIKGRYRTGAVLLLLLVFVAVIYTVGRYAYYGDVIANTFYNKVSGGIASRLQEGIAFYFDQSVKTGLLVAVIVGFVSLARVFSHSPRLATLRAAVSFPIVFLTAWSAYLIYIGGDIYYERFVVATIPLSLFVILSAIRPWPSAARAGVLLLAAIVPFAFAARDGRYEYHLAKYDMWVQTGKFLGQRYPGATIAVDAAGKIPFFSELPTIDMLGLNDRHIGKMDPSATGMPGHTKFDPAYVLARKPELIAAGISPELDMAWGMSRERYFRDYGLKYLVNTSREDLGPRNIIDVAGMPARDVSELIAGQHYYGILLRRGDRERAAFLDGFERIRPGIEYSHVSEAAVYFGWSHIEPTQRWSLGASSRIGFFVDDPGAYSGRLSLYASSLGTQRIAVALNAEPVYSATLDSVDGEIAIPFLPSVLRAGYNELALTFPDARQPGNGDPRVLALALRGFRIQ